MLPSVSVVMLCSAGRDAMRCRAIAGIRNQSYSPIQIVVHESRSGVSIGELRNEAIERCFGDISVHADDDDWSHPQRIEEQVRLLEASSAEAVGYSECLFWDERDSQVEGCGIAGAWARGEKGQSYLYSNPHSAPVGASLCYWRETWKRRPFPHLPMPGNRQSGGEDVEWLKGVKCEAVSSMGPREPIDAPIIQAYDDSLPSPHGQVYAQPFDPRLICSIHSNNSSWYELALSSPQFKRAAQFDQHCKKVMAL